MEQEFSGNVSLSQFALRLRKLRLEENKSLETVSKDLRISVNRLMKYENDREIPSMRTIDKLASYYAVSRDWLLGMEEESPETRLEREREKFVTEEFGPNHKVTWTGDRPFPERPADPFSMKSSAIPIFDKDGGNIIGAVSIIVSPCTFDDEDEELVPQVLPTEDDPLDMED